MELTAERKLKLEEIIGRYPEKRSALLPALHLIQEQEGSLSSAAIEYAAALFALTPAEMGMEKADLSRVIQGIVTGIGFIGAGAILKQSEQGEIHGLTTAAGIWLTAGIGIAVGLGKMAPALVGTILALVILSLDPWLTRWVEGGDEGRGP